MAALKAIAPVFDSETGRTFMPGRTFEIDDARAASLVAAGAASRIAEAAADTGADAADGGPEEEPQEAADMSKLYEGMTRDQLLQAAEVRGIEVPSKATKAEIRELLAGAR